MTSTEQIDLGYEILPPGLAIKSMRCSGYRDTAHALAELIDNSIQAGAEVNECTNVELLCIDKVEVSGNRRQQHISNIAVYDNATGMDANTLRIALQFGNGTHLDAENQKGIGKFGMGLPNASISQCLHVDIWSWQHGECLYTYLDIDEIRNGTLRQVPEPKSVNLPDYWRRLILDQIGDSGTLVVWSKIDRATWKTSKALFRNTEFLVGRMYRYFLRNGTASIRFACFEDSYGEITHKIDEIVRPNDPLYLMDGTSTPDPYDILPAFDYCDTTSIDVKVKGNFHKVQLKWSVVKLDARREGGHSPIGKHTSKNQGISIVRADRELELNHSFDRTYEEKERWWGLEVQFPTELDDVFGVTNNKQSATAFMAMSLESDANAEGMTPEEYRDDLRITEDPRLAIYEISEAIRNILGPLRKRIDLQMIGTRTKTDVSPPGSAEDISTRATRRRKEQLGEAGASDLDENLPDSEREEILTAELVDGGLPEDLAQYVAVESVRRNVKYLFQQADVPGYPIFDVKSKAGTIIVVINTNHPASDDLFELLKEEDGVSDTPELRALKLLLTAWARLEDTATDQRRETMVDLRMDWGRIARDFLQVADE